MQTLAHRRCRRRLDALVDGELAGEEAAAATRHVGDCPDCARQVLLTARITAVLRRWADRR